MISAATRPKHRIFNRPDCFAQGWYWAVRSRDLTPKTPQQLILLGKPISLTRNEHNQPVARAHSQRALPAVDRYGLIWVWVGLGDATPGPLPHVPGLDPETWRARLGGTFTRQCHPNVLLINAIDAHHFNAVHNLPVDIRFQTKRLSSEVISFRNTTRGGDASRFVQLIQPLYQNEVTYHLHYWYGNTGTVTLGPDFLHFYLMFALRPAAVPTADSTVEGQIILLTPDRPGIASLCFNLLLLQITQWVAAYFAHGDRKVFDSIHFDFKVPLAADSAILDFIHHVDRQPAVTWQSWQLPCDTVRN